MTILLKNGQLHEVNYHSAPNAWGKTWQLYIDSGILPGSFGEALLRNDLVGAVRFADHININLIPEHVMWLFSNAPANCWGSVEKVNNWIMKKRVENDPHRSAACGIAWDLARTNLQDG